jgi:tellurite resistance protein
MNAFQRKAFDAYEAWCKADHPPVDLRATLALTIGYMVSMTDGRPDADELALMRAIVKHTHPTKEPANDQA